MTAELTNVADAVATVFAGAYAAERVTVDVAVARVWDTSTKIADLNDWNHAAPEANEIKVFVTPVSEDTDLPRSLRGRLRVRYLIGVLIVGKPKDTSTENVDPLVELLQEMKDYFFKQGQGALPSRDESPVAVETITHPDIAALLTDRCFKGQFVLTFEGWRAR